MKPKIVAFDLDDTVIGSDGQISPENFNAIKKLSQAGITPVVVTGRTYYEIPASLREFPWTGYIIYGDGAVAVDSDRHCVFSSHIPQKDTEEILSVLREYDTMPELFYDGKPYAEKDKLNSKNYSYYGIEEIYHPVMEETRVPAEDFDSVMSHGEKTEMFNVFFHSQEERDICADRISDAFPEYTCTHSMQNNLEVLQKGVNKGASLKRLAQTLSVDRADIIAVGDSPNDLSMIKYAGTGLAVANACDALKEVANAQACSNDGNVLEYIYENYCC